MTQREIACALVLRESEAGTQVLLEQRAATNTVMPGLWELPGLSSDDATALEEVVTVRHAIMQVNYTVRVHVLPPSELSLIANTGGAQRWIQLAEASTMALTGLARKVLTRAGLLQTPVRNKPTAFALPAIRGLL